MIPDEDCYLMWQYCKDLNDIDEAVKNHDENWEGLESLHQIKSITYDVNHGCYVVFWIAYRERREEPEPYKEKLDEIASALSEKFAYMNTCLNERDIILGYLGVKRPCETHCYTDCTNTKCKSHPSFAQPEQRWIPVSEMEPKKSGHYLCTHVVSNSFGGIKIVCPDYYTTQEEAEELFADPEDEYLDLEEYIGWTSKNVIAWMPMPEPYREEGE